MKQMNNFISGLVIKEEPYGEKAKLLHVLTQDAGILKMKAPGAYNLKSSTHSAVQLFTFSEFSLAKGKNGFLTITGATAKNNFFGIRTNIESYALACYFSSLISRVAVNDISSSEILRLTMNCLYAMSDLKYKPERVKPIFEIRLAVICGFSPNFTNCTVCGYPAETFLFDLFSPGLLCSKCKNNLGNMVKSDRYFTLTEKTISVISYLSICDMKQLFKFKLSENDEVKLRNFAESFVTTIFEKTPKTLTFYNHLMRSMQNEKLRQKQENT